MPLFKKANKEPRKPKDWALIGAVTLILGAILTIFANQYVENFPLTTTTLIFILSVGLIFYGVVRGLRYKSPFEKANIGYWILFVVVLAGILFFLIWFNISPSFAILGTELASMVGI